MIFNQSVHILSLGFFQVPFNLPKNQIKLARVGASIKFTEKPTIDHKGKK